MALLDDIHALQRGIVAKFTGEPDKLRYLIAGSRTPGVFSLGGDLDLFATSIRQRNRQALIDYGKSCVRVLHRFHTALDLPIVTIGVAQGDALGGGLESLLSFNVIIAERGAKFGFPEIMFGLFPGMGAYSLVARRTTAVFAEKMMLSGKCFTADEMKEIGLVHIVAEPGQGIAAAREYMQRNKGHHAAIRGVFAPAARSIRCRSMSSIASSISGLTPVSSSATAISRSCSGWCRRRTSCAPGPDRWRRCARQADHNSINCPGSSARNFSAAMPCAAQAARSRVTGSSKPSSVSWNVPKCEPSASSAPQS